MYVHNGQSAVRLLDTSVINLHAVRAGLSAPLRRSMIAIASPLRMLPSSFPPRIQTRAAVALFAQALWGAMEASLPELGTGSPRQV